MTAPHRHNMGPSQKQIPSLKHKSGRAVCRAGWYWDSVVQCSGVSSGTVVSTLTELDLSGWHLVEGRQTDRQLTRWRLKTVLERMAATVLEIGADYSLQWFSPTLALLAVEAFSVSSTMSPPDRIPLSTLTTWQMHAKSSRALLFICTALN